MKNSIKWIHSLLGLADLTEHSFITNILESAKRLPKPQTVKKEPVSTDNLVSLCSFYSGSVDIVVIRDLSMILLAFVGFLRYDELSSLKCYDITFFDNYMSVRICKSKTDRYRLGDKILVSKGSTVACPLTMLRQYFKLANIDNSSHHFLFRPIFRSG